MQPPELRCGIDVGRTSTDAVAMNRQGRLVGKAKVPTTGGLRADVGTAVRALTGDAGIDAAAVTRVMFGSTYARDAVLERRGLKRVATIRIGAPLTLAIPPLWTWPADLREEVSVGETVVRGGSEYDGRAAAPLDEDAVAAFLARVAGRAEVVAITGVFSPVAPEQELAASDVVARELGAAVHVSLSHAIGTIGLLERENATVLNAALTATPDALASALRAALEAHGIDAELFLSQNDGTLMAVEEALSFPVLTIGSGPAGSMRGAAQLSGVGDAVVADVGGTSATVGALARGTPRESVRPAEIAGVRMRLGLPELRSVDAGRDFEQELAAAVDRVKASLVPGPLVVVGGAAARVPDVLPGVSEVIRPADRDVAGAIGAAIAPISGQADLICANRPEERRRALREAREAASARAVRAGADPDAVQVVQVDEVPLTYLVDPAIRIRVKAAGPGG